MILMDLRMPGMDGVTAIAELARRGNPARVLVLTTYDTDSYVLPAIEAGATGYLLKDAPRDELLRAVRAAAAGQSVLAPSVATRLMNRVRAPEPELLSQRELEVLGLVAAGTTNREAAARLFISEATVKTHLLHIYAKLGVTDRAAAVAEAFNRGLLTPVQGTLTGGSVFARTSSASTPGASSTRHEPVRGDVEDAQVGDDPLDDALAGVGQRALVDDLVASRPWRRAPSARSPAWRRGPGPWRRPCP